MATACSEKATVNSIYVHSHIYYNKAYSRYAPVTSTLLTATSTDYTDVIQFNVLVVLLFTMSNVYVSTLS